MKINKPLEWLENVAMQYPWAKEMVKGKGGQKAVRVKKTPAQRVSHRQQQVIERMRNGK